MGHRFAHIAFTDTVREVQRTLGSRAGYAAMEAGEDTNHALSVQETGFIAARDSFYIASVSETGWPYLQHRGGPAGFVRVLDEHTIGFADFRGNRQYVSVGNVMRDDRVALFFMDYPRRTRLKLLGRARLVGRDEPALLARLEVPDYRARVERGFLIHVEAFDWNCPQHITPRYTEAEIASLAIPGASGREAAQEPASSPAAWGDGPLELVISAVRQLTPRVRAYELRHPQGFLLPAFPPGAHLQVPVRLPDGRTVARHYSIASDPADRMAYEIAVLRVTDGAGGSSGAHEGFTVGLHLNCGLPQNNFPLHGDARPAVLVAGGIGITPLKAMAHARRANSQPVRLHYAARGERELAFRRELGRLLGDDFEIYPSLEGRRMDVARILADAPADAVFYVCGPERLIDAVALAAAAAGVDANRVRYEHFT
jgi:ferredoxin-NADP reductase/predicted pyridoxine 5'-phosphate oxidase superfamily flavin-nucleotide-binding protein